jgi:hypothetical protein
MSNAVKVVRALANATGPKTVFNDRLVDGTRSIKVWGWQQEDYKSALRTLQNVGLRGRIVRVNNGYSRNQYRLWVA